MAEEKRNSSQLQNTNELNLFMIFFEIIKQTTILSLENLDALLLVIVNKY